MYSKLFEAWQTSKHAVTFDRWAGLSKWELKKTYESFNEIRLFLGNKRSIDGRVFYEIGCATGELWRYLKNYHPEFRYVGFDISRSALDRARKKYPEAEFVLCDIQISNVFELEQPSVLFSRDVVLHQPSPFEFLRKLVSIPREAVILRLRTRDVGETVLDINASCQFTTYGKWVPYLVLNVDEMIETILSSVYCKQLIVVKHYQQLGGSNRRYLPRDLYLPRTGGAVTTVYIELSNEPSEKPEIKNIRRDEPSPNFSIVERLLKRTRYHFPRLYRVLGNVIDLQGS